MSGSDDSRLLLIPVRGFLPYDVITDDGSSPATLRQRLFKEKSECT